MHRAMVGSFLDGDPALTGSGFLGLGKKDKAHTEEKRKFELKEMKRKEELANKAAELERMEMAIKEAELKAKLEELAKKGISVPGAEKTEAAKAEGLVYLGHITQVGMEEEPTGVEGVTGPGFLGLGRRHRTYLVPSGPRTADTFFPTAERFFPERRGGVPSPAVPGPFRIGPSGGGTIVGPDIGALDDDGHNQASAGRQRRAERRASESPFRAAYELRNRVIADTGWKYPVWPEYLKESQEWILAVSKGQNSDYPANLPSSYQGYPVLTEEGVEAFHEMYAELKKAAKSSGLRVGYVGEEDDLAELGTTLRRMHRGWHADTDAAARSEGLIYCGRIR